MTKTWKGKQKYRFGLYESKDDKNRRTQYFNLESVFGEHLLEKVLRREKFKAFFYEMGFELHYDGQQGQIVFRSQSSEGIRRTALLIQGCSVPYGYFSSPRAAP